MADPELSKAFSEHQAKMIETNTNVTRIQQQIEELRMSARSAQLTEGEIATLPEGTRLYEGIGRLFILTATSDVKEHMKTTQETAQKRIKILEKEKQTWEASLKQSEANIRELVSQKRK